MSIHPPYRSHFVFCIAVIGLFLTTGVWKHAQCQDPFIRAIGDTAFGSFEMEYATSMHRLSSGNLTFVGNHRTFVNNMVSYEPIVHHTNSEGVVQWVKGYHINAAIGHPTSYCSKIAANGDVIIVGQVNYHTDMLMMRLTANGDLIWSRSIGDTAIHETGYVVAEDISGNLVFAGAAGTGSSHDIIITKTDSNGNVIWSQKFAKPGSQIVCEIAATPDGGTIICGRDTGAILLKVSTNGQIQWSKEYRYAPGSPAYGGMFNGLALADNGDIVVAGRVHSPWSYYSAPDALVARLDHQGNMLWSRYYGNYFWEYLNHIRPTNDGGFVAVGCHSPYPLTYEGYVLRIDSTGQIIWDKGIEPDTGIIINPYSTSDVLEQPDGDFDVLFNRQLCIGNDCGSDLLLVHTNSLGNAGGCNEYNPGTVTDTIYPSWTFDKTNSYVASDFGTPDTVSMIQLTHYATASTVCGPPPLCLASFTASLETLCLGDTFAFTRTSEDTNTFSWYANDTLIGNDTVQHWSPNSSGTFEVYLTSGAVFCSDTAELTVTVHPALTTTLSVSDSALCQGDTAHLLATGGVSYQWTPSGGLDQPFNPDPIAVPQTTTNYSVLITDSNGCEDSETVTIQVNNPPNLQMTSGTTICAGDQAQLSVSGASTYLWQPGGTLNDSTIAQPLATPTQDTTYYVTGTDSNGCTSVDSFFVVVLPGPTISFNASPTTVYLSNPTVQFNAFTVNAILWNWDFGDGGTGTGLSTSHTYTATGLYTIKLVAESSLGCEDSLIKVDEVKVKKTVGMGDNSKRSTFDIYPNPANDILVIQSTQKATGKVIIRNVLGNTVYHRWIDDNAMIETTQWSSGLYVLEFLPASGSKESYRFQVVH